VIKAIYGFRGIEPIDTSNFIKGNHFKEMILDENYRSNQAIVDISGTIIKRNNSVFGKIQQKVSKPLIAFLYRQNQENLLINQYRTRCRNAGTITGRK
jgi:superfamily I DNA/RNA helicase